MRSLVPPKLLLPDDSADILISVEAANNYFSSAFAAEIFRCLKSGGVLVMADCPLAPFEVQRLNISATLEVAGLKVENFNNITSSVVESCRQGTPRKMALIGWMPQWIRREFLDMLCCDPSPKLDSFLEGRRAYYLLRAVKHV